MAKQAKSWKVPPAIAGRGLHRTKVPLLAIRPTHRPRNKTMVPRTTTRCFSPRWPLAPIHRRGMKAVAQTISRPIQQDCCSRAVVEMIYQDGWKIRGPRCLCWPVHLLTTLSGRGETLTSLRWLWQIPLLRCSTRATLGAVPKAILTQSVQHRGCRTLHPPTLPQSARIGPRHHCLSRTPEVIPGNAWTTRCRSDTNRRWRFAKRSWPLIRPKPSSADVNRDTLLRKLRWKSRRKTNAKHCCWRKLRGTKCFRS